MFALFVGVMALVQLGLGVLSLQGDDSLGIAEQDNLEGASPALPNLWKRGPVPLLDRQFPSHHRGFFYFSGPDRNPLEPMQDPYRHLYELPIPAVYAPFQET